MNKCVIHIAKTIMKIKSRCMTNNKKYIRRPILVIATDCEEVNKQMFLFLKDKIEQKPSTHSCH